jgi:hypothetical protein
VKLDAIAALGALQMDDLLTVVAAIVFVIIPAVKTALEARRKQEAAARTRSERSPTARTGTLETPEAEARGRELFERLLRGEVDVEETARPAPLPPPIPTVASAPPRPRREAPIVLTETRALTETPPMSRPPLTETAPLTGARPLTETAPLTGRSLEQASPYESLGEQPPALVELAAPRFGMAGRDLPAQASAADANAPLTVLPPVETIPAAARSRRAASISRTDWRRAVILAEVLAPPVALRRADAAPGLPAGLR